MIKSEILFLLTAFILCGCSTAIERTPSVYTSVPKELIDLLPANQDQTTYLGETDDGLKCKIELSTKMNYSADITVYDDSGKFNPKRSVHFQVGFGSELIDLKKENSGLVAIAYTKAGEQYSSDQKSFLMAQKRQQLEILRIRMDSKGFFGWSKKAQETCHILK